MYMLICTLPLTIGISGHFLSEIIFAICVVMCDLVHNALLNLFGLQEHSR